MNNKTDHATTGLIIALVGLGQIAAFLFSGHLHGPIRATPQVFQPLTGIPQQMPHIFLAGQVRPAKSWDLSYMRAMSSTTPAICRPWSVSSISTSAHVFACRSGSAQMPRMAAHRPLSRFREQFANPAHAATDAKALLQYCLHGPNRHFPGKGGGERGSPYPGPLI